MTKAILIVLLLLALLPGCKSTGELKKDGDLAAQGEAGAETQGLAGEDEMTVHEVMPGDGEGEGIGPGDGEGLLSNRTIYFDFDSAQVRSEDVPTVTAHAKYLIAHPDLKVVLEGHTDERGSREYNIALSEARAIAVAKLLELEGVPSQQVSVVPYGEEKPVALGHNEEAWRQNRRVEIVYERKR